MASIDCCRCERPCTALRWRSTAWISEFERTIRMPANTPQVTMKAAPITSALCPKRRLAISRMAGASIRSEKEREWRADIGASNGWVSRGNGTGPTIFNRPRRRV